MYQEIGVTMKVLKESLLLNDLKGTLDVATQEEVLVMSDHREPMIILTLESYNELKANLYKKEK